MFFTSIVAQAVLIAKQLCPMRALHSTSNGPAADVLSAVAFIVIY
jgi:hypothetical protein